jgi:hypothetical protein
MNLLINNIDVPEELIDIVVEYFCKSLSKNVID